MHKANCARQGLRKLVIRTVDTDVVVLAIGHSRRFSLMNSALDLASVLTFDRLLSTRLLKMSMKKHRCSSMLSVGATLCLAASDTEQSQPG